MKNVIIYTIVGNFNFGNKLQHYATQTVLEKKGFNVVSKNTNKVGIREHLKSFIKFFLKRRYRNFYIFDKKIKYENNKKNYDYYLVGSDQVWNTNFDTFSKELLLEDIDSNNKISFSSSFGVDFIESHYLDIFQNNLKQFKSISVREETGKKIIKKIIGREDVQVLVDPTMLLTASEWNSISKKPRNLKTKKFILNYFLGELSDDKRKEIERIAIENECEIIDLLDKNSSFYNCGPSEFLYLEANAFLICTDSFHSSVFAILFNRPFIIFDREEKGMVNMSSRIDTLISKFNLEDRRYNGKEITCENLQHNYSDAYKVLEEERKKSDVFLNNALDII